MDKFRAEQVISDCKLALSRFDDELIADECIPPVVRVNTNREAAC